MRLFALVFTAVAALGAPQALAQQFPSQPVRVVVPFPPGGGTDILVRLIQDKYSAKLGQPVVIDNRPGASGNIGAGVVAKSKPDGYTLLVQATIVGIYPSVYASLPYDPQKDFAWIGGVAESPAVIVTNPNSKFKTINDLINEGKTRPVNFASAGVGSPQHLATERLSKLNQVQFTHVPYKGSATAVTDLLSGVLDFGTLSLSSVLPLIQEGKLRALALASDNRSKLMPDVPTIKEAGLGDVSGTVRFIIGAPDRNAGCRDRKALERSQCGREGPGNPGRLREARLRDHAGISERSPRHGARAEGALGPAGPRDEASVRLV